MSMTTKEMVDLASFGKLDEDFARSNFKSNSAKSKANKGPKKPKVPLQCYLLGGGLREDETAPSPEGCSILLKPLNALIENTLPREKFGYVFSLFVPGIMDFVNKGDDVSGLGSIDVDLEIAKVCLE